MALQMQNAFSLDVAEFGRFNRMQSVLARPKPVEPLIARMNCGALIPVLAVYFDVVGHAKSMRHIRKPRKKRPASASLFFEATTAVNGAWRAWPVSQSMSALGSSISRFPDSPPPHGGHAAATGLGGDFVNLPVRRDAPIATD
jgi:hypothetical protein